MQGDMNIFEGKDFSSILGEPELVLAIELLKHFRFLSLIPSTEYRQS